MTRIASILGLLTCGAALAQQDATVFTPPQAYPVDRYEAGWGRNPFTLKTAPVVVGNASFAKDLAIAGISGDTANPTVTVVNIKTHERFRLKLGQPGENGMLLNDVKRAATRKDSIVEVTLGAETSKLHYDNSYLKQVAATSRAKSAPPSGPEALQQLRQQPRQPRPTAVGPPPQTLRLPIPSPPPARNDSTVGTRSPALMPSVSMSGPPAASFNQNAPQSANTAVAPAMSSDGGGLAVSIGSPEGKAAPSNNLNLSVSSGTPNLSVSSGKPVNISPGQVPSEASQVASAAPVPERRRMITPITNVPPVQQ